MTQTAEYLAGILGQHGPISNRHDIKHRLPKNGIRIINPQSHETVGLDTPRVIAIAMRTHGAFECQSHLLFLMNSNLGAANLQAIS